MQASFLTGESFGGYPFRIHPRPPGRGILRRRVKRLPTFVFWIQCTEPSSFPPGLFLYVLNGLEWLTFHYTKVTKFYGKYYMKRLFFVKLKRDYEFPQ